jgi:hypothetical protein
MSARTRLECTLSGALRISAIWFCRMLRRAARRCWRGVFLFAVDVARTGVGAAMAVAGTIAEEDGPAVGAVEVDATAGRRGDAGRVASVLIRPVFPVAAASVRTVTVLTGKLMLRAGADAGGLLPASTSSPPASRVEVRLRGGSCGGKGEVGVVGAAGAGDGARGPMGLARGCAWFELFGARALTGVVLVWRIGVGIAMVVVGVIALATLRAFASIVGVYIAGGAAPAGRGAVPSSFDVAAVAVGLEGDGTSVSCVYMCSLSFFGARAAAATVFRASPVSRSRMLSSGGGVTQMKGDGGTSRPAVFMFMFLALEVARILPCADALDPLLAFRLTLAPSCPSSLPPAPAPPAFKFRTLSELCTIHSRWNVSRLFSLNCLRLPTKNTSRASRAKPTRAPSTPPMIAGRLGCFFVLGAATAETGPAVPLDAGVGVEVGVMVVSAGAVVGVAAEDAGVAEAEAEAETAAAAVVSVTVTELLVPIGVLFGPLTAVTK